MIFQNETQNRINVKRSRDKDDQMLRRYQSETQLQKEEFSRSKKMMEDFLDRQQQYEKINRLYQKVDVRSLVSNTKISKYQKFKDALLKQSSDLKLNALAKKKQQIEEMADRLRKQKMKKKREVFDVQKKSKQLDLKILLLLILPIVFLLTIIIELI